MPLYKNKYIHEDSEEKKSGKEKIIESPTLAIKKVKTIPRVIIKVTFKITLIIVTKLVKKARKIKTVCDGSYNIIKM